MDAIKAEKKLKKFFKQNEGRKIQVLCSGAVSFLRYFSNWEIENDDLVFSLNEVEGSNVSLLLGSIKEIRKWDFSNISEMRVATKELDIEFKAIRKNLDWAEV